MIPNFPHRLDENLKGNPVGGLVFSRAFGQLQQIHEWTASTSLLFVFREVLSRHF
jgi:hypothetical protein